VTRRLLLTLLLALALPAAHAQADTAPPAPVPLDTGWEYASDDGNIGLDAGWSTGEPDAGWRRVAVPHVANPEPTQRSYEGSVGWYRLRLTGPEIADGRRWAIRFEGARRTARVWLNGEQIGEHLDPYTPFELELPTLSEGRMNTLVVRTDYVRPTGMREGWWNFGGLVRRVSLVQRGAAHLEHTAVMPRRVCESVGCQWTAIVDTEVVGGPRGAPATTVELDLAAPDGIITTGSAPVRALAPGERAPLRYEVAVAGPIHLWWPHNPALYRANVRLRSADRVEDIDQSRVGLRTVGVLSGQLQLNGKPLSLRGASIQEDLPGRGSALSDADIDGIVADVEGLHADVTRAHYLLDERLLRRFDERGILVWSQAPVYHRDADLDDDARRAFELENVRDTVLQARRHPSVIVHSVANELSPEPDRRLGTRRFLIEADRIARQADPTRPVALDLLAYPGYARQRTHARFDVLGINHYYGWYEGRRGHSTRNFAGLARHLRAMDRRYPRQALVVTEFGAEGVRTGPHAAKGAFAFQTWFLRRTLNVVNRERYLSGAIYWTAREFAVKPRWKGGDLYAGDSIHSKGLLFHDGRPKPAWFVARDAFRDTPTFR
jgi:beta-glucuronidase